MMKSIGRLAAVISMAGAMVATGSVAASAVAGPSSDQIAAAVYGAADPAAAFTALPADQQAVFAARMKTWTATEGSGVATRVAPTKQQLAAMGPAGLTAAGGCWQQYKYYEWHDLKLHTGDTWMTAHWCSNGSNITTYSLSDQGGRGRLGIKYEGLGAKYVNNVGWEVRQAQTFKFSVVWASANPCMQIRGGKTGLYSFQPSCNMS